MLPHCVTLEEKAMQTLAIVKLEGKVPQDLDSVPIKKASIFDMASVLVTQVLTAI